MVLEKGLEFECEDIGEEREILEKFREYEMPEQNMSIPTQCMDQSVGDGHWEIENEVPPLYFWDKKDWACGVRVSPWEQPGGSRGPLQVLSRVWLDKSYLFRRIWQLIIWQGKRN